MLRVDGVRVGGGARSRREEGGGGNRTVGLALTIVEGAVGAQQKG
jgi:hypothetical protein